MSIAVVGLRKKILSVVGARPQFVKLAAIARAMTSEPLLEHLIVHTGQHYEENMSDVFFEGLNIPAADINLAVGSGTHGAQTGAMLAGMDTVLADLNPDLVLVYGDTNSTLAGALAAVKMHIPVAHLEAGLRSFNRMMPEEHNRILTDHAADLLLAPTQVAVKHLTNEGLQDRTVLVGDVMADICLQARDLVKDTPPPLPSGIDPDHPYVVATIHRAENTDDPERLRAILSALQALDVQVLLLTHPRLADRASRAGLSLDRGSVVPREPLAYHELISVTLHSSGVVTDSGGLQKEAYLLGKLCTTVRPETEWIETLEGGWNVLSAAPSGLAEDVGRSVPAVTRRNVFGDGHAADAVLEQLMISTGLKSV